MLLHCFLINRKDGTNFSPCVTNNFVIHPLIQSFSYNSLISRNVSDIVLDSGDTLANKVSELTCDLGTR